MMAKLRVPIDDDVAAGLLYEADRTCCICGIPGRRTQIHHIDEDPSNNDPPNLAVICFECHDQTQLRGGFGRRLDAAQVRRFKQEWATRVAERRAEADRAVLPPRALPDVPPSVSAWKSPEVPDRAGLPTYVRQLPTLRRLAFEASRAGWDSGVTVEMMRGWSRVIDVYTTILETLASYYPVDHLEGQRARDYLSEVVASRFRWHRVHLSTEGQGSSGTIVGPMAAASVAADLSRMIDDMVSSLTVFEWNNPEFDLVAWRNSWEEAGA